MSCLGRVIGWNMERGTRGTGLPAVWDRFHPCRIPRQVSAASFQRLAVALKATYSACSSYFLCCFVIQSEASRHGEPRQSAASCEGKHVSVSDKRSSIMCGRLHFSFSYHTLSASLQAGCRHWSPEHRSDDHVHRLEQLFTTRLTSWARRDGPRLY